MRKILFGVALTLIALFVFKYFEEKKADQIVLQESSVLIQKEINNVGKLIVTEGHFSEVFNYKNSREIFGDYFTSEKKALVVVNTDVIVSYDLSKIDFELDEENKTLIILNVPEEDIKINPDIEYYDTQADFFNPFEAKDYNDIKQIVKESLAKKVEHSSLKVNAKNRLVSELSKFYILTNSLGWTLQYNNTTITKNQDLKEIKF